jgi:hypothetical protein
LNLQAKSVGKKLLKIAGALVGLYAVITMKHVPWPAFVVLPFKPLWNVARKGHLAVGDMAPDFSLESPDHKSTFQLSSMRGQTPVVLVFGSYT